jgi:hypothetical protein
VGSGTDLAAVEGRPGTGLAPNTAGPDGMSAVRDIACLPFAAPACDHGQMDRESANRDSARDRDPRFRTLPARIHPESTIAMVGVTSPRDRPETADTEEQRQVFLAGG